MHKDDLRDMKESATDKNDELHRHWEQMVEEVEDFVGPRREPQLSPAELDRETLSVHSAVRTVQH